MFCVCSLKAEWHTLIVTIVRRQNSNIHSGTAASRYINVKNTSSSLQAPPCYLMVHTSPGVWKKWSSSSTSFFPFSSLLSFTSLSPCPYPCVHNLFFSSCYNKFICSSSIFSWFSLNNFLYSYFFSLFSSSWSSWSLFSLSSLLSISFFYSLSFTASFSSSSTSSFFNFLFSSLSSFSSPFSSFSPRSLN